MVSIHIAGQRSRRTRGVSRRSRREPCRGSQALELDPEYPWAHRWLGEACLLRGFYEEAEKAFATIEAPVFGAGFLGYCYARTGRVSQARQLLQRLEGMTNPQLASQIAVAHLGLGEREMALHWLRKACDAHAQGIHWLRTEPIWDTLRPDNRFTELLTRLGLPECHSPTQNT